MLAQTAPSQGLFSCYAYIMSDEEKKVLLHARRKIKEVRENTELLTDLSFNLQFDAETGKGSYGLKSRPSPNSVKAATADIRHFLLNKSPILWGAVMKICINHTASDQQDDLRKLGKYWSKETGNSGVELGMGMGLNLNGKSLTRKELLHLWINGDLMHIDADASEDIALMRGNPFIGLAELVYIGALQNLAILLFNLDERFIQPLIELDSTPTTQ
jgi:hypothetical protein